MLPYIEGVANVYADMLSRDMQDPEFAEITERLRRRPMLSVASREVIWQMQWTAHLPEEYLTILEDLETQDAQLSSMRATTLDGRSRT